MILPDKYLQENDVLIGVGATLLSHLSSDANISELWDTVKESPNIGTFKRFILGLDFLFMLGLVTFHENKIKKIAK